MLKFISHILVLSIFMGNAQEPDKLVVLGFKEYLGYVKKYHPVAKQAELKIEMGQANLMRSRGGFDPMIELDYDKKEFKGTEYYDRLNATFKIPTWFGIDLKGNFEQNNGDFLNPENRLPIDGLYSAGVSMSVGQGFWINERMATLRKAKFFREQSKVDRDLQVNQILFEASLAYFDWLQAYQDHQIFQNFLDNSEVRFTAVSTNARLGEVPAIDTLEAKIVTQDRALNLEQAKVRLMQKSLVLSNFLWLNDNIPIELNPSILPDIDLEEHIDITLEILGKPLDSFTIQNHPKLKSLGYKIDGLQVERNMKANKMLPVIDLEYNILSEAPNYITSFEHMGYKGGLNFKLPLFLRKERGDLKLAKLKLEDAQFERDNAEIQLRNKTLAIYRELESFEVQNELIKEMVNNYNSLLTAEERKFSFGESSLFLINSREGKLIEAKLKQNEVLNKYFTTKAKLFNSLAGVPENL